MHIDARELENKAIIEADICIVGAGPAGISMALDWVGKKENIVLLESGGFEYDDAVQDAYKGENTGLPYYPLKSTRLHYFGGTSNHWGGFCSRLDPIDFEARPWVADSGWPISLTDLEAFYPKAHELVELGPYQWSVDYWLENKPNFRQLFPDNNFLWDKIWKISPPTRFGKKYRDAIVSAPNIHLYTFANVTNIISSPEGQLVTEVEVRNLEGKSYTVKAKHFVLAGGAMQNARMLLAANTQQSRGLGNQYDVVGRYFMEHIEVRSGELWLTEPNDLAMYMLNMEARAEIAVRPAIQQKLGITNGTVSLSPLNVANHLRAHSKSWSSDDPRKNIEAVQEENKNAEENKILKRFKKNYRMAFSMFSRFESAPNRESRVFLDTKKDAMGVPLASLHWQLSEIDKKSIRRAHELIGQQLGAEGKGRVKVFRFLEDADNNSWSEGTSGGWHHMGTTRMGNDPRTSVVDRNCRVHGMKNLYCAGSSCFPTSGAANPTLSLVALSLRLSAYLKGTLGV